MLCEEGGEHVQRSWGSRNLGVRLPAEREGQRTGEWQCSWKVRRMVGVVVALYLRLNEVSSTAQVFLRREPGTRLFLRGLYFCHSHVVQIFKFTLLSPGAVG